MQTRGRKWSVRFSSKIRVPVAARSSSDNCDLLRSEALRDHPIFIRRLRRAPIFFSPWRRVELSEVLDPNRTGDENGIKPLLKLEIGPPNVSDLHRTAVMEIEPRSWFMIVVRSWPDHPAIGVGGIVGLKPRCRQVKSTPRPFQSAPTTASNGQKNRAKFPFKSMYSPFLLSLLLIDL